ncbi:hypothetical protein C8R44DRAFT_883504 [Mycena epipterygia]|nr:hypothetical protein C8R44DRAFT_883504 [Mycena epipterygia]
MSSLQQWGDLSGCSDWDVLVIAIFFRADLDSSPISRLSIFSFHIPLVLPFLMDCVITQLRARTPAVNTRPVCARIHQLRRACFFFPPRVYAKSTTIDAVVALLLATHCTLPPARSRLPSSPPFLPFTAPAPDLPIPVPALLARVSRLYLASLPPTSYSCLLLSLHPNPARYQQAINMLYAPARQPRVTGLRMTTNTRNHRRPLPAHWGHRIRVHGPLPVAPASLLIPSFSQTRSAVLRLPASLQLHALPNRLHARCPDCVDSVLPQSPIRPQDLRPRFPIHVPCPPCPSEPPQLRAPLQNCLRRSVVSLNCSGYCLHPPPPTSRTSPPDANALGLHFAPPQPYDEPCSPPPHTPRNVSGRVLP